MGSMGKDRIEIDGEWYVREKSLKNKDFYDDRDVNPVYYLGIDYEIFEFSIFYKIDKECNFKLDEGTQVMTIKVGGDEYYWDNDSFLKSLADMKADEWDEIEKTDYLSKADITHLRKFIAHLSNKGYLVIDNEEH
jgi:hypothetical protein